MGTKAGASLGGSGTTSRGAVQTRAAAAVATVAVAVAVAAV